MLRKISREQLKENIRFSAPVFFDDGTYMLVNEGIPIRRRELDALVRWDIPYVLTSGKELQENETLDEAEELEELEDAEGAENSGMPADFAPGSFSLSFADFSSDSGETQKKPVSADFSDDRIDRLLEILRRSPVHSAYEALVDGMDAVFAAFRRGNRGSSRPVDDIAGDLIRLVRNARADVAGFVITGDVPGKYMAKKAVNTAVLSLILAESLFIPDGQLARIVTGALLHDVGMLRVPEEILCKTGRLSESERDLMRCHVRYGYKIIVDEFLYPEEVGRIAELHHEHWDGSGYPSGLAGDRIPVAARIVAAADAFAAMVSPEVWRDRLSGYDAMKNLVADNARHFDPDIVKAVIRTLGIYPVGSVVLLNTSAVARVLSSWPDAPLRPEIKILIDEFGKAFPENDGETVDLRANKTLFIVRAVTPAEIAGSGNSGD